METASIRCSVFRSWLARALLLGLGAAVLGQAPNASAYPSRPIRFVVPFTPGSASDILARTVGERLAAAWGQPVLVENRPGAGGTIGTGLVAKAEPDGHTLAVVSAGHVVNPVLYPNLGYDTLRDFSGVIPLGSLPSVLAVPPALGVHTAAQLVALAKQKPGLLNYATGGIGSGSHVNVEKFVAATGIEAVHMPLKGAPEMVAETMTGRAHFGFHPIIAALPAIRDGRLVALAVSSPTRSAALPQVPTIAEAGYPRAEFNFWIGVLAPARTPRDIVARLNTEIGRILQLAEVYERLTRLGVELMPLLPEQFDAFMRSEHATLAPLLQDAR